MKRIYVILFLIIIGTTVLSNSITKADEGFDLELRDIDLGPPNADGRGRNDAPECSGSENENDNWGCRKIMEAEVLGDKSRQVPSVVSEAEDCGNQCQMNSSAERFKDNRIKLFSQYKVLDAAFSPVNRRTDGNICHAPGLDALFGVLHKDAFCWVSLDGESCTLSEFSVTTRDEREQDIEVKIKDVLEEDEQGKPEVQQITQKVLEVLPEAAKVNFALSRDGAKVLAFNQGAKRVGALLDDDSDTFMRNDCKDNKWVVIELSQVAKVSSLDISQNELYSSRLKEFSVYGMQSHPRTLATLESSTNVDSNGWSFMGKFEGKKSKGVQSFDIDNSRWVRYLLIRFLTHYGTENVCAINEIAVYGTSAAEELEAQLAHDELVFDSVKEQVPKEGENDTIGGTTVSNVKDDNNSTGLLPVDNNVAKLSDEVLVILNNTSISGMQRIFSQNLFSYAALNHSSPIDFSSQVCMQEEFDQNLIDTVKKNTTGMNVRSEKAKGTNLPAPPPTSSDDLVPIPKPKSGGNLYETLIQELRATKAQQKMISKSLEGMHKNVESVAEDLASLRKSSGLLESFEIQQKIDLLEHKLHQISRKSSHQSNAAITLFAAVMALIILQLDMFSAPAKQSVLMDVAKGLVALNIFVGGALMFKGTFTSFLL